MPQRWRYVRNNQQFGPVTTSDLRLLADQERLKPTDLVCAEGTTKWVEAGSVKGLFYTGPGQRPRGAGRWVAACLIVFVVLGLLGAGGLAVAAYSLHWLGSAPPVASTPPDKPAPAATGDEASPGTPQDEKDDDADPGVKERTLWRIKGAGGSFQNTHGKQWVEKNERGTFEFVETERTPRYIELHDKSRNMTLRIRSKYCFRKTAGGKFVGYLEGHWEEP